MAFFSFREKPAASIDLPDEIRTLLSQYKGALPDLEPHANFMPELWQSIESRRRLSLSLGRIAKGFVTAAAALCLLMSALFVVPQKSPTASISSVNYLDVLSAASDDSADVDPLPVENL
jgi:hypothetical protein